MRCDIKIGGKKFSNIDIKHVAFFDGKSFAHNGVSVDSQIDISLDVAPEQLDELYSSVRESERKDVPVTIYVDNGTEYALGSLHSFKIFKYSDICCVRFIATPSARLFAVYYTLN